MFSNVSGARFPTRLKGNVPVGSLNGCGKLRRCVAARFFWEAMLTEWRLAALLTAFFRKQVYSHSLSGSAFNIPAHVRNAFGRAVRVVGLIG